jgi:hypothetical protein
MIPPDQFEGSDQSPPEFGLIHVPLAAEARLEQSAKNSAAASDARTSRIASR